MKFESKYNLGDIVYMVKKSMTYKECPLCEGIGKVLAQVGEMEYSVTCPTCKGHKKIEVSNEPIWNLVEEVFVGVGNSSPKAEAIFEIKQVIVSEQGIVYKISLYNSDLNLSRFTVSRLTKIVGETEVFTSREEAIEYCNKMNGLEPLHKGENKDV